MGLEKYEQHGRRLTDSKLRRLWHGWMPILSVCASVLISFGGAVWTISSYKTTLENTLSDLKTGQADTKKKLADIDAEHHIMMNQLNKVMFRLRIPLNDPFPPEYHTWPMDERKGPDAEIDVEKLLKNDGHSRMQPQQPVVGSMQAPFPPLNSDTQRPSW